MGNKPFLNVERAEELACLTPLVLRNILRADCDNERRLAVSFFESGKIQRVIGFSLCFDLNQATATFF
jgi:hypothetical protein